MPQIKATLVLEAANIPASPGAEELPDERDVLVIPDLTANAGGVSCALVKYHGGTRRQAFELIDAKIRANTAAVRERSRGDRITPRAGAVTVAHDRLFEDEYHRRPYEARSRGALR